MTLPRVRPAEREYTANFINLHPYRLNPLIIGRSPISMFRFNPAWVRAQPAATGRTEPAANDHPSLLDQWS